MQQALAARGREGRKHGKKEGLGDKQTHTSRHIQADTSSRHIQADWLSPRRCATGKRICACVSGCST
jgi:hypothetical protein